MLDHATVCEHSNNNVHKGTWHAGCAQGSADSPHMCARTQLRSQAEAIVRAADKNGDGIIDYNEVTTTTLMMMMLIMMMMMVVMMMIMMMMMMMMMMMGTLSF